MLVPLDKQHTTWQIFQDYFDALRERNFCYYASDIIHEFGDLAPEEEQRIIQKAIGICKITGIPVYQHFKPLFREEKHQIKKDWKITGTGGSLVIMSYDLDHDNIKEIQHRLIDYLNW